MIKITMLDDHPLILSGISTVLSYEKDFEVLGAFNTSSRLYPFLSTHPETDLLILDLQLKNETGEQILQYVKDKFHQIKVIILTNIHQIQVVKSLINLGANGYLLKTSALSHLPQAIRSVMNQETYIAEEIKEELIRLQLTTNKSLQTNNFSSREIEILQLISEELTTQEIALKLGLSNRTIDNYRLGLMQKLEAKNMIGMVKKALLMGLIK